jgi:hypothetical protein
MIAERRANEFVSTNSLQLACCSLSMTIRPFIARRAGVQAMQGMQARCKQFVNKSVYMLFLLYNVKIVAVMDLTA